MRLSIDTVKKLNSKPITKCLLFVGYLVTLGLIFLCIINVSIINNTRSYICDVSETLPENEYDCILVLGCGVRADGSPTPRLEDRLIVALDAYNKGHSGIIFLTGDSEEGDYTETVTMKNYLIENGVDEANIVCDGYGLSTYESIWRAKNVYGFDNILIVTQKYHLHRALYIAEKMNLSAIGFNADLRKYSSQLKDDLRESLARFKDMIYSQVMPIPKYTEKWEVSCE